MISVASDDVDDELGGLGDELYGHRTGARWCQHEGNVGHLELDDGVAAAKFVASWRSLTSKAATTSLPS